LALITQTWDTLRTFIQGLVADLDPVPVVYIDTAPINAVQDLTRNGVPLIGIFDYSDHGMSRNTTRWNPFSLSPVFQTPATLSVISAPNLYAGAVQTITLGPTAADPPPTAPNVGDAVSCILAQGVNTYSQAVSAEEGFSYTALAASLVAAINTDPEMSLMVLAENVGPVISILNITGQGMQLNSLVGSSGSQITEWAREVHPVLIDLQCKTYQDRANIGSLLLGNFAKLQAQFGLQQPDTTWINIRLKMNAPKRNTHPNDLYRWLFILDCETGLTTQDVVYLAIQPNIRKTLHY